jgi:hypothetical protein
LWPKMSPSREDRLSSGGTGDRFAHERGGDAVLLVCRADVDAYLGGSVPGGALVEGAEGKPASQCALVLVDPKRMVCGVVLRQPGPA